jgi:hypothetical protein
MTQKWNLQAAKPRSLRQVFISTEKVRLVQMVVKVVVVADVTNTLERSSTSFKYLKLNGYQLFDNVCYNL